MIQLAYLSSTPTLLSPDDIAQILLTSRENNRKRGITGILLYCDGDVLQVLEGAEETVQKLFEVIQKDTRHRRVIRLYEKPIEQRDFAEWTMGFRDLKAEGATYLEGYNDILGRDFELASATPSGVQKMLSVFKAGLR